MSKGKQRPPQYIRQSKGYQQNLYKKQMKEQDIQVPKSINIEKITKINRILGIVWIVLIFLDMDCSSSVGCSRCCIYGRILRVHD